MDRAHSPRPEVGPWHTTAAPAARREVPDLPRRAASDPAAHRFGAILLTVPAFLAIAAFVAVLLLKHHDGTSLPAVAPLAAAQQESVIPPLGAPTPPRQSLTVGPGESWAPLALSTPTTQPSAPAEQAPPPPVSVATHAAHRAAHTTSHSTPHTPSQPASHLPTGTSTQSSTPHQSPPHRQPLALQPADANARHPSKPQAILHRD